MKDWNTLLREGIDDIRDLRGRFSFTDEELATLNTIQKQFPMFVTDYYLSLIEDSDPEDPIRKMCIPQAAELERSGTFDTSGEQINTVMPGLQHKYRQTALILSTNRCAMYCRHCFRKRLVGSSEDEIARHLDDMARYIDTHTEISNVLISGGDAFMNSTDTIAAYLEKLTPIYHLDYIRFGTRTPVVLPQRITTDPELIDVLRRYCRLKQLFVITQYNHPGEITAESEESVRRLKDAGLIVRNQTVLLRGINDRPEVLGMLQKELTSIGVLPYYVFQCRPVTGVKGQFQVPLKRGYRIVEAAKNMQNGQGKSFRFVLSHETGKIEVLGEGADGAMLFKYHQAKYAADSNRIFSRVLTDTDTWL